MERDNSILNLLSHPSVYRMWQAPFAEKKIRPLFENNDVASFSKVLDVGCGPGTNATHFAGSSYLGIDRNAKYVQYARKNFSGTFEQADATRFAAPPGVQFDFILINSLLHHIDDPGVTGIIEQMTTLLDPRGRIHVLDLVLPETRSVAWYLARTDRGQFPRALAAWEKLFSASLELEILRPYPLTVFGITLWNMVYVRGRAKT